MIGRHVLTALAAAVLSAGVTAQTDRTDDFVRGRMKEQRIPGLSLAVVQNGAIVKQAGYGYADLAKKITATPDTVYKIASVSKSVLATGVLTLVQDGKIGLDDPVGKYFALTEIIRKVSGRSWTEYMEAKVFRPAGMGTTYPTNTTVRIDGRAVGYVDNDNPRPAPHWVALRPSGAFLSTVLDLAKWDAALDIDRIVSASTRREMWTPVKLWSGSDAPYGLGWFVNSSKGRMRVQHTGGMPGARAGFVKYLDDRLTIIVLMNLDDVDIDAIIGGLAALYLS